MLLLILFDLRICLRYFFLGVVESNYVLFLFLSMVINFFLLRSRFLSNSCGRIFTLSQLNFLCTKTVKWLFIIFLFYNEIRMIFSLTVFLLFIVFLQFLFGFLPEFAMQEIKETIIILFFMFWKHIEIALQREWIRRGLSYQIEIVFEIIFYLNTGS